MKARSPLIFLPLWLVALFAVYIVLIRLAPYLLERVTGIAIEPGSSYPWNFMPVTAICVFGGARFANRAWALLIPLGAFFVADLGLAFLKGASFAFGPHTLVVYGGIMLAAGLGLLLRGTGDKRVLVAGGMGLGVVSETIFYVVSNTLVWLLTHSTAPMNYTFDAAGLLTSLTMGLPFYGRAVASTLFYGVVLFGGYALLTSRAAKTEPAVCPASAR